MLALLFITLFFNASASEPSDPLQALFQEKIQLSSASIDPKVFAPKNRTLWLETMQGLRYPRSFTKIDLRPFPAPEFRQHLPEVYVGWVPAPAALYVARLSLRPKEEPLVNAYLSKAKSLLESSRIKSANEYLSLLQKACSSSGSAADFTSASAESGFFKLKIVRVYDVCLPTYLSFVPAEGEPIGFYFLEDRAARLVLKSEPVRPVSSGQSCKVEPTAVLANTPDAARSNVMVAIIDSGVDYNHPALGHAMADNAESLVQIRARLRQLQSAEEKIATPSQRQKSLQRFLQEPERLQGIGWDFLTRRNQPMDFFDNQANTLGWMAVGQGHGTHVAGIARGDDKHIQILPIRMIGQTLQQAAYDLSYDALTLADLRGAKISNISMDGPMERGRGFKDFVTDHPNMLLTIAAGNGGIEITRFSIASQAFVADNVIRVAAVDLKTNTLSAESNFSNEFVDVAADGVDVQSCTVGGEVGRKSGTSMASPRVAQLAASLLSLDPKLTPVQIKEIICDTADSLPALADKVRCGLINPRRAIEKLTGKRGPNSKKAAVPAKRK